MTNHECSDPAVPSPSPAPPASPSAFREALDLYGYWAHECGMAAARRGQAEDHQLRSRALHRERVESLHRDEVARLAAEVERLTTALQRIRILATNGNPMSPEKSAITMDMIDGLARAALAPRPSPGAPAEGE